VTLLDTTPTSYRVEMVGKSYEFPRVTSVLSLVHRFDGISLETLEHAAERGLAVHRAIWLLEGGGDGSGLDWDSLTPDVLPYVLGYEHFKDLTGFRVVERELFVVSYRYGVAGRLDLLVEGLSRRLDVLDLKSGAAHPAHHLQASAYLECYREQTGSKRALGRQILYLRDTGVSKLDETIKPETHAQDWSTYLGLLAGYRWAKKMGVL
jgi:hypothetical protein